MGYLNYICFALHLSCQLWYFTISLYSKCRLRLLETWWVARWSSCTWSSRSFIIFLLLLYFFFKRFGYLQEMIEVSVDHFLSNLFESWSRCLLTTLPFRLIRYKPWPKTSWMNASLQCCVFPRYKYVNTHSPFWNYLPGPVPVGWPILWISSKFLFVL